MQSQSTPSATGQVHGLAHFLGIAQICSYGTIYYAFPLIVVAMQRELGWSKSDVYGALTIGLLLAAALAYPVGLAIDRGHGKRVMVWGSLTAAVLFIAWSFVQSLFIFYLIAAAMGSLQAAILYESAFALLARRVGPQNSRAGITTITLWAGFASTVFIPLEQFLLDGWGWRASLWVLALVNIACAAGYWHWIRPELDAVNATHTATSKAENIARDKHIVHEAFHSSVFWLLLIALTTYSMVFSVFTFHMYPMLLDKHLPTNEVVWAISIIGPAQVLGRIIISRFATRVSMRTLGSIMLSIFPFVFATFLLDSLSFQLVAALFGIYGLANGVFTIVRSQVVPEMLSAHAYGALNGLITVPTIIARAIGPVVAAWLWAIDQSYDIVLIAQVGAAVLLTLLFWAANLASRASSNRLG
ncbi:MFS transporter [Zwartia vadi]|uniref:MFS transporter n=1 Tax=Zwartia vadi TaxID=3058168 RepID=UPI0025B403D5|nr:MFS transporter [Zwartia vadi]MDN3986818.1 MFS transporter [Zwartia vadi]